MPLLHRKKKEPGAPQNLNAELPPSPPASNAPSSVNSNSNASGPVNTVTGHDSHGNIVTTTTTTTTTTVTNTGPYGTSEPQVEVRQNRPDTYSGSDFSNPSTFNSGTSDYSRGDSRNNGYDAPNIPQRNEMRGNQQYPEAQRHDMRGGQQYQDSSTCQKNDPRVNQQDTSNFQRNDPRVGQQYPDKYPDTANSPRMGATAYHQDNAPGGTSPGGNASSQNFSRPRGTVEGVKAVAHGIHGAGELLRGTLNSAVGSALHEDPVYVEQSRATANRGRQEMGFGHRAQQAKGGNTRHLPAVDERTTIL